MTYLRNTDYLIDVARGEYPNTTSTRKFGRNEAIGTTEEDIIDSGGSLTYLTSAETMNIASTSAADTDTSGTGAWTMQIYGVDGNYAPINEVINLNGTSNVASVNTYLRVYRMKVLTAGTGGKNAGTLTATAATSITVQAQITIGYNQTLMAAYTVGANTTGYIFSYYFSVNKKTGASADVQLYVRPFGGVFQLKHVLGSSNNSSSPYQHNFRSPLTVSEKSDILIRAIGSTTNVDVSAGFDLTEET